MSMTEPLAGTGRDALTDGGRSPEATRRAYEALRDDIAAGRLEAGTWLRESTLAAALGLSRTPVREALRVLAREGVVELVHNRGARVVSWSVDDIDETYRLRALLEGHGAALAARGMDAGAVAELEDLERRYERALTDGSSADESATCNNAFHAAIMAASGSPRLQTLLDVIASAPLVTQALHLYDDDDRRRSVLQHRDIITAIAHGDEALAESAMRSHILAARYAAMRVAGEAGGRADVAPASGA